MSDSIDVFEVTFKCPQCKLVTVETTTDLFNTFYLRACGQCECTILKVMRCKHIFGDPIPDPDDFFELRPDKE